MNLKISVRNNFGSSWHQSHGVVFLGTKFGHGGVALAAPFQCVARCHSRPRRGWSCGCGGGRCDQPIRGHGDRRDRLALPTQAAPQGKSSTTSWSRPSAVQSSTNATASKKASPKRAAKKATPLRPPPFKAPPQEVQIRRTNSPPTMKSPPMAPSQYTNDRFDDELPLAATFPENLRLDEPSTSTFTSSSTSTSNTREPVQLPSRSQSWPVRRTCFNRWPYNLIFYRRCESDSNLWRHWWIEEVD